MSEARKEEQRPEISIGGETRKLQMTMGALADLEDAGYEIRQLLDDVTAGGKTGPLIYLAWTLLREGAEDGQREITIEELRKLSPRQKMPLAVACVAAVRDGFAMESSDDGVHDPVLEEIEKKDEPDA